jgi:hypothetical protein
MKAFREAMETMNIVNARNGWLDAMSTVSRLSTITGHPIEAETLDRVVAELEIEYQRRYK